MSTNPSTNWISEDDEQALRIAKEVWTQLPEHWMDRHDGVIAKNACEFARRLRAEWVREITAKNAPEIEKINAYLGAQQEPDGEVVASAGVINDLVIIKWTSGYHPKVGDKIYAAPAAKPVEISSWYCPKCARTVPNKHIFRQDDNGVHSLCGTICTFNYVAKPAAQDCVSVPMEPTWQMCDAGVLAAGKGYMDHEKISADEAEAIYRAMLAAHKEPK